MQQKLGVFLLFEIGETLLPNIWKGIYDAFNFYVCMNCVAMQAVRDFMIIVMDGIGLKVD